MNINTLTIKAQEALQAARALPRGGAHQGAGGKRVSGRRYDSAGYRYGAAGWRYRNDRRTEI